MPLTRMGEFHVEHSAGKTTAAQTLRGCCVCGKLGACEHDGHGGTL